jgi:hypothetical protein
MLYRDFLNLAIDFGAEIMPEWNNRYDRDDSDSVIGFYKNICVGGSEGGNCWKQGQSRAYTNEVDYWDMQLGDLRKFLLAKFPEMTYVKGLQIEDAIKTENHSVSEYYGNYREFLVIHISVETVHKIMFG